MRERVTSVRMEGRGARKRSVASANADVRMHQSSRRQQNFATTRKLLALSHLCNPKRQTRVNFRLLHAINKYSLHTPPTAGGARRSYAICSSSGVCTTPSFLHSMVHTSRTAKKRNTPGNQENRTTKRSSEASSSLACTADQLSSGAIGNY